MNRLVGAVLLLVTSAALSGTASADGFHVLELDRLSMETARLVNYNDPYFGYADPKGATTEHWDSYTAVKFDLNLVSYSGCKVYLNNTVDGAATSSQYRSTSWEWEAGLDARDRVQMFWHHHSIHVLDAARDAHFPLTNYYGVRVVFFKRGNE